MKIDNKRTKLKTILLKFLLPSLVIILFVIGAIYYAIDFILQSPATSGYSFDDNYGNIGSFFNGLAAPVLTLVTALFALWAFLSQRDQLNLQKEDSALQRIEGTFFQLLDFKNNVVDGLEFQTPGGREYYQKRAFFKKAYEDLVDFYNEEVGSKEKRLKHAMTRLDKVHVNNFHIYYKSLFQLFFWVYDHRDILSKKQKTTYVELIRSQLSYYEMTLIYFNAKFFGRNMFYKVLDELGFLAKYNIDGYGSVEERFDAEASAIKIKEEVPFEVRSARKVPERFSQDELYRAIKQKELEVYFQPIVDMKSKRLVSVEALVRWHHPERGLVEAKDFLAQMEVFGFADNLFEYLLEAVCKAIKMKKKSNLVYSINVSMEQLLLSDFIEMTEGICRQYKVPPGKIQFEITEGKELYQREQIKSMIETLRMKGFRVGIDDFGSGYFSFHDLMNLSIDFVKLDKQFVDSLDQQENHRQMIQHIIGMLKDKGCQITIEGIETESQFAAWKALEVDLVQGYYIAKPMPVKQLKRWMHKG